MKIKLFFLICIAVCIRVKAQNPTYTIATAPVTCPTCCNGSFTVNLGGCSGYTVNTTPFLTPNFTSSNTCVFSNACAGFYTITINGAAPCGSVITTGVITNSCPTPITFSINQTPATCSTCCNGSVTVTNIQNGCAPYTSSITPNATSAGFGAYTNLCAGTNYTILVSDAGCCGPTALVCTMNYSSAPTCTAPISFILNPTNASCFSCCDGSASASNISGGCPPYNINWSTVPAQTGTVATGLCAGSYTATVSDAGCCPAATATVYIFSSPPPPCTTPISYSISVTPETCIGCCDGSAIITGLNGGCPPYSYVWSPGAMTTSSVGGLCSGNYSVTVQDAGCCPAITQSCFIPPGTVTGILKGNVLDGNVVISPNPSNGTFYIEMNNILNQNGSIIITDINGKVVYNKLTILNQSKLKIDIKLEDGLYFLNILADNKNIIHTQKIIINK